LPTYINNFLASRFGLCPDGIFIRNPLFPGVFWLPVSVAYSGALQPIPRINKTARYRLAGMVDSLKVMLARKTLTIEELVPTRT